MSLQNTYYRLPISIRLTLWYGLSMAVLIGLFSVLLITGLHWSQHIVLHQRLFRTHSLIMPTLTFTDGVPAVSPSLAEHGGALHMEGPFGTYVRLLSPEGEVWDQSTNFANTSFLEPVPPDEPRIVEISRNWGEAPVRSFYAPILDEEEQLVGWLEASGFAWNANLHLIGWPMGIAIPITVLLALVGGYLLARRALKPVSKLTEAANQISASELSIRLPIETRFRDELTDLAETFNTMIARLEGAFERERRFTANAAHELLNPLASVRNEVEVALRRPRDTPAYQQTLRAIEADVQRLGKIVEQLLQLAHVEATANTQTEPIDLTRLCQDHVAQWKSKAQATQIDLRFEAEQTLPVKGHTALLDVAVDNLLENAMKYTPAGGWVTVAARATQDKAMVSVSDSGIGFDAQTGSQLFDRFYRAEMPEVQARPGSGLGLAIVQAVVQAYGGTLQAHSEGVNKGSVFEISLPLFVNGVST